jgi:dolichyl-phosphate beta-glucosyltransferase
VNGRRNTVVIPCFNEQERLNVAQFEALAGSQSIAIVFVDDGSTDETARILEALAARHPKHVSVVQLRVNVGKGEAVRAGMLHALEGETDVVGYLDADLAAPIGEYVALSDMLLERGLDAVIGARVELLGWDVRRSRLRHYLGRVFATAASLVLQLPVYDTQCGAKVFRATPQLHAALVQPFDTRWVFDVELLARLTALDEGIRGRIAEMPLREWADVGGSQLRLEESLGAFVDLMRILRARRRRTVAKHAPMDA